MGRRLTHQVQVALGTAGFEAASGSQQRLLDTCRNLAARIGARILPGLPWNQVPAWLAGSAAVIVPSLAEMFGLVPRLRARLAREQQLIQDATEHGWPREVEHHKAVVARIHELLTQLGEDTQPDIAETCH